MSSTQFNKGPSYGLSAEVKNRVSEGAPSAPAGLSNVGRAASAQTREEGGPPTPYLPGSPGAPSRAPLPAPSVGERSGIPPHLGVLGSNPFP